jgi:Na+-driven multidrug efflux pump
MGATGVALAVLVAYIVHTFIQVFYLIRKNRYDLSYKSC